MPARTFMRALTAALGLGSILTSTQAHAQSTHTISIGAEYVYTRTNVLPGCDCISLQGGAVQVQYGLTRHFAVLGDLAVGHKSGITPDGYTLTQTTYTAGIRYLLTNPAARARPFAEITLGGANAAGSLSPANSGIGGSGNAFAFQAGGGLQLHLRGRFTLQPIEAQYLLTTFSNTGANVQNDLRISSGFVLKLGRGTPK